MLAGSSTAEAVRIVAEHDGPWAALGQPARGRALRLRRAAGRVEDVAGNETRFVWLALAGAAPGRPLGAARPSRGPWKTAIVFWGVGSEAPGWLVRCLSELADRDVNLTRIESRPRKQGLGRYMFFADLEGRDSEPHVAEALAGPAPARRGAARAGFVSCGLIPPRERGLRRNSYEFAARRSLAGSAAPPGTLAPAMAIPVPAPARSASPPEHQRRGPAVGRVLVLNATYEPINVCTVRRAVVLLLKDKAEIIEHATWELHSATAAISRPVVIRLVTYVRIPRDTHRRKITRRAVFARDDWTCQYCGSRSNLTVDHVVPRSKGGGSSWDNIVASCAPCNRRKGNSLAAPGRDEALKQPRTPEPARVHPGREPDDSGGLAAVPGCVRGAQAAQR